MSQENVDRLREGYEAFNRDGPAGVRDLFHPDFETMGGDAEALEGITVRGPEGVEQWFETMAEAWEELRLELEELIDVDQARVVAVVRLEGRGKGSGVDVEGGTVHVWTLRDGMATHMDVYATKPEALEALGLEQ